MFGRSTIKTKNENAKIYQVMLAINWSLQDIEHIDGVSNKKIMVKISPKIQHQLATSGTPKTKISIWIGGTTFVDTTTKKSWVANACQIWLVVLPLWTQEQRNMGNMCLQHLMQSIIIVKQNS